VENLDLVKGARNPARGV